MGFVVEGLELGERAVVAMTESGAIEQASVRAKLLQDSIKQVFEQPRTVIDTLPRLTDVFRKFNDSDLYSRTEELASALQPSNPIAGLKINRFLGEGVSQIALGTESGVALKMGSGGLTRLIPHPAFDAPVLGAGQIGNDLNYYMQPIGDTSNITGKDVASVVRRIRNNGFLTFDMGPKQVAIFGKTPLLIDQESAVPRYGTTWEAGKFSPHIEQEQVLADIRDYLNERNIPLNSLSTRAEFGTLRSISPKLPDLALTDGIYGHLTAIGAEPTMMRSWSEEEIRLALDSLAMR